MGKRSQEVITYGSAKLTSCLLLGMTLGGLPLLLILEIYNNFFMKIWNKYTCVSDI